MKRLISVLLLLCMLFTAAAAEETVTVQASVSVEMPTDCASVTLGLYVTCATVSEATAESAAGMERIIAALTDAGIRSEDITTWDYSVNPEYDYSDVQRVLLGYSVSHMLQVTIRDKETAGRVIDAATAAGANQVYSLTFVGTDQTAAYDEALTAAVGEARRKAGLVADACGRQLGGVLSVTESGCESTPVVYRSNAKEEAANGTVLHSAAQTVTATVTVVFALQ